MSILRRRAPELATRNIRQQVCWSDFPSGLRILIEGLQRSLTIQESIFFLTGPIKKSPRWRGSLSREEVKGGWARLPREHKKPYWSETCSGHYVDSSRGSEYVCLHETRSIESLHRCRMQCQNWSQRRSMIKLMMALLMGSTYFGLLIVKFHLGQRETSDWLAGQPHLLWK